MCVLIASTFVFWLNEDFHMQTCFYTHTHADDNVSTLLWKAKNLKQYKTSQSRFFSLPALHPPHPPHPCHFLQIVKDSHGTLWRMISVIAITDYIMTFIMIFCQVCPLGWLFCCQKLLPNGDSTPSFSSSCFITCWSESSLTLAWFEFLFRGGRMLFDRKRHTFQ